MVGMSLPGSSGPVQELGHRSVSITPGRYEPAEMLQSSMRLVSFAFTLWALCTPLPVAAGPFERLRAAYAARDAEQAAAAYAPDATVTYRYDASPEERHTGREAIAASFRSLFDQIDAAQLLDLNFRAIERRGDTVAGVYRLRIGSGAASYGRFSVKLTPEGLFASDLSTSATLADFEAAAGPVMLATDEEILDRGYYGQLTGRYRRPDGCVLVVTRSVARLFVRDTCTDTWRGLTRKTGLTWTAGDRVLSDTVTATYRFDPPRTGFSPSVAIIDRAGTAIAMRRSLYRQADVTFASRDGTRLAGTLYVPEGRTGRLAASVLIHGSGPQDRDGYASIIAVLADQLAASGRPDLRQAWKRRIPWRRSASGFRPARRRCRSRHVDAVESSGSRSRSHRPRRNEPGRVGSGACRGAWGSPCGRPPPWCSGGCDDGRGAKFVQYRGADALRRDSGS